MEARKDTYNGGLSHAGEVAMDSVKNVVGELAATGKETYKQIADEGKKQLVTIEDYIKEHPVRSIMMSAAAGIVLSRIIKY